MSPATVEHRSASDALSRVRSAGSASITLKEVAEVLGVDPRTAAAALSVHGGDIPSIRVGKRIVIPRERFLAYFDGTPPTSSPTVVPTSASETEPSTVAVVRAKLIEMLVALDERPRPAA